MKPRQSLPESAIALATKQAGAITRAQLLAEGVGVNVLRRMLSDGTLLPITRGVYALTEPTWLTRAWAGLLIAGPAAVVGGIAALHLHDLAQPPSIIDIYTTAADRPRVEGPWRFIRSPRRGSGSPPRTSLGQALVDATADMAEQDAISLVLRASRRADRGNLVSILTHRKHHPHRQVLLDVLKDADGAESVLELRYARDVEHAHGLPKPQRQVLLEGDRQCDVYYDKFQLVIELDGDTWHTSARRAQDMARDNLAALLGLTTLRYSWALVMGDPCAVAREVAAVLTHRGWTGHMHSCSRCR